MPEKKLEGFSFETSNGKIVLPDTVIESGDYAAFPFNLTFGNSTLKYATATPLCRLNGKDIVLFNKNGSAEFDAVGEGRVIVISKKDAKNAYKILLGAKEHLVITDGEIYTSGNNTVHEYAGSSVLKIYPKPDALLGFELVGNDGEFALYNKTDDSTAAVGVSFKKSEETDEYTDYTVRLAYGDEPPYEAYVGIDFAADLAEIYIDGEKVNDMYYTGVPFELSLRYHSFPSEITVRLYPLREDDDVYLEKRPEYKNGKACDLCAVSIEKVAICNIELEV